MVWQELTQKLDPPWNEWARETIPIKCPDNVCVLYVPLSLSVIAQSLEFLTQVFPLVKILYPHTLSLLVSTNPQYDLVVTGDLLITNIGEI